MNEVLIVDNFLTNEECDGLIDLYKRTPANPKDTEGVWYGRGRWIEYSEYTDEQFQKVYTERQEVCRKHFGDNLQLVDLHMMVWNEGDKMLPHSDYGAFNEYPYREYASLIYLNDDYEGGSLIIPELKFKNKPKKGQLVAFQGGKYYHGVTEITKGTRYTCLCWFKIA